MNKLLLLLFSLCLLAACKSKKAKPGDDEVVEVESFIDFFPDVKLPYQITDSLLNEKPVDSSSIGWKVFTQFVPDSIISNEFGTKIKPKIYPMGKSVVKGYETYLFVDAVTAAKKVAYILAFGRDNKYIAGMPLVVPDKDPATSQSAILDSKYSLSSITRMKNTEGVTKERKNVYILNAEAKTFTLILTDAGLPDAMQEIINPIDTFPRKNKFAGDYQKDKRNYISIRDGRNASELLFFVHFEKEDGDCSGELKGTASVNGNRSAIFRANGNPCVLEFTFAGNSVSMKEVEACGSYRDITCFFDGSYARKKELKAKKAATKK